MFTLLCVLVAMPSIAQADQQSYNWNQSADTLTLKNGSNIVWSFNYGKDADEPFFHPLNLGNGTQLTRFEPESEEHPWHRGLWFAFKYIDGVNYWEEDRKSHKSVGVTTIVDSSYITHSDFSATIKLTLDYHPPDGKTLITEQRSILVSPPNQHGDFFIDWEAQFTAHQDLKLGRTPLATEPEGKNYGGYAGLSLRFPSKYKNVWQFQASNQTEMRGKELHGTKNDWLYFGNGNTGAAIFEHPANTKNDKTHWYVSDWLPYMSPAFLFSESKDIKKDQSWHMRNRIQLYSTKPDTSQLNQDYEIFALAKIDLVELGKTTFTSQGCIECHAISANSQAVKTGPNLFGLVQNVPRKRKVIDANGKPQNVLANYEYVLNSLRKPKNALAIKEQGTEVGSPFLPVMPAYKDTVISRQESNAIYAFLQTLNADKYKGPKEVWQAFVPKAQKQGFDNELLVGKEAAIARNSLPGLSTRSVHIGLPNQASYSFDTSTLAIGKIWWGGFMNASAERLGRADPGHVTISNNGKDWPNAKSLLRPLNRVKEPLTQGFKSWPVFKNGKGFAEYTHAQYKEDVNQPYLDRVEKLTFAYRGLDTSDKKTPSIKFDIDGVSYSQKTHISDQGVIQIEFSTQGAKEPIYFTLDEDQIESIEISTGQIENGIWQVPANQSKAFSVRLEPKNVPTKPTFIPNIESPDSQLVVWKKEPMDNLPFGYQVETLVSPKDKFGRSQMFEPLGIDFAKDGTAVIAARTAGIWKIKNNRWTLFADGFHDPLGVSVDNHDASSIVVAHKPELTRVIDTDKDGVADQYTTISDAWRLAGNYCEYVHGPVRDEHGNFFINLNLAHGPEAKRSGGAYMGSYGGYDGWTAKITKEGHFVPWASGLRSPAGLGMVDESLFYTENQGSFVGTSKMFMVEKSDYFGYPASLMDDSQFLGKPLDNWQEINKKTKKPVIFFPHSIVANSPGNPTINASKGSFGPFKEQIFVGDQTSSKVMRIALENIGGQWQGVVMPFVRGLRSGAMRLSFSPEGELWIGQTERGWASSGEDLSALQRIIWDGKNTPFEILTVNLIDKGFNVSFTDKLAKTAANTDKLIVRSWYYKDTPKYGSERFDLTEHNLHDVRLAEDNLSIEFKVNDFKADRIYEIIAKVSSDKGKQPSEGSAYYTLHNHLK